MSGGVVYFILQEDYPLERGWVKVGWTGGEPLARLRALQTGNPDPLRLLAALPGTKEGEAQVQKAWEFFKTEPGCGGGEWFFLASTWKEIELWGNLPSSTLEGVVAAVDAAFDLQIKSEMGQAV